MMPIQKFILIILELGEMVSKSELNLGDLVRLSKFKKNWAGRLVQKPWVQPLVFKTNF